MASFYEQYDSSVESAVLQNFGKTMAIIKWVVLRWKPDREIDGKTDHRRWKTAVR